MFVMGKIIRVGLFAIGSVLLLAGCSHTETKSVTGSLETGGLETKRIDTGNLEKVTKTPVTAKSNHKRVVSKADMALNIDNDVKFPQIVITDKESVKENYYKNQGDVGGGFIIKVSGPKDKVKVYQNDFKIFDLKVSSHRSKEVNNFLSRRDKIIERDRQIRLGRQKRNSHALKQKKLERVRKKLKIEKQMENDMLVRIERQKKIALTLKRNQLIRLTRSERNKKLRNLNDNHVEANKKDRVKKISELPVKYNPNNDLLIEIAFLNPNVKNGFFIMSFDPNIRAGEKHIYRQKVVNTYKAFVNTHKGEVLFRMARSKTNHILKRKYLKVGKDSISFTPQRKNISVDLIVTSVGNISRYSGFIAGWKRSRW